MITIIQVKREGENYFHARCKEQSLIVIKKSVLKVTFRTGRTRQVTKNSSISTFNKIRNTYVKLKLMST